MQMVFGPPDASSDPSIMEGNTWIRTDEERTKWRPQAPPTRPQRGGGGRWLLSLPGSNIISPPLVLIHHIGTLGTEPEWIYGLLLFTVGVQEETGARSPGFLSGGPVWIRGAGRISRHHPRTNDLIMRRRRWILIIV